jgi:Fe-S-cluster containining protein
MLPLPEPDNATSPPPAPTPVASPLGIAESIAELLTIPGHLCKQRGICCKVATFKGSLSLQALKTLAAQPGPAGEMARDFLSVFIPYPDNTEPVALAPVFVERVYDSVRAKGGDPQQVGFFHCKYLLDDGRCGVHEDRPIGCRKYPLPLPQTIYHPGCGYEQRGVDNLKQIDALLAPLGTTLNDVLMDISDG